VIPLDLTAVAAATGGRVTGVPDGEQVVVGATVVTDARLAVPGSLYVAREGEHADGHAFVADAVARGAVAALTTRPVEGVACVVVDPGAVTAGDGVVLQAADAALGLLARAVLDRLPELTVTAVTGSVGKTGTKDLLGQVLATAAPTVAAEGSYNGEVGVPLTVLRAGADTRHLVVEMGARGTGHIRHLTTVAPPDVAVVLNVGSAHLGEFGSRAAIATAKAELVQALRPGGTAVLNADDPVVAGMARLVPAGVRVLLVGESATSEITALDVRLDASARPSFSLSAGSRRAEVSLRLHGEHQVATALAATGAALAVGLDLATVADALSAATARSRGRMEVTERPDGVIVVNDAYNANPESMRAALKSLALMSRGRRSVAVVGEMLARGPVSTAEHDALGRLAVRLDVRQLVVVGDGARHIHLGAAHEGSWDGESLWVPDVAAAWDLLADELVPGDVVLVKSSRDAGLRRLGDRLAALGAELDAPELDQPGDPT